ncbi:MAG: universal stress protein [Pseudomonadota bacterium]
MSERAYRVLVPVDGSECSNRAVEFLARKAKYYAEPLEVHLLNVQHPFPGTIRGVHRQAQEAHHEEGMKALAAARRILDEAGVPYQHHIAVGEPADTIVRYVKEKAVDQVVMGTHGRGAVVGLLLGSVASKVLQLVEVPVLLVK